MEIKRLKEELERQHVRVREIQHEMAKKVAEERSIAERRYNYQVFSNFLSTNNFSYI